jgi:hypothetical protein
MPKANILTNQARVMYKYFINNETVLGPPIWLSMPLNLVKK